VKSSRQLMASIFLLVAACGSATADVLPDYYSEPGLYPNRDYVNQHAAEHIDPFSGSLQLQYTVFIFPGMVGLISVFSALTAARPFIPAPATWLLPV